MGELMTKSIVITPGFEIGGVLFLLFLLLAAMQCKEEDDEEWGRSHKTEKGKTTAVKEGVLTVSQVGSLIWGLACFASIPFFLSVFPHFNDRSLLLPDGSH